MKFQRRFGKTRKPNSKKGLFLVVLLIAVILLWMNAEKIVGKLL